MNKRFHFTLGLIVQIFTSNVTSQNSPKVKLYFIIHNITPKITFIYIYQKGNPTGQSCPYTEGCRVKRSVSQPHAIY